jgi:transposase
MRSMLRFVGLDVHKCVLQICIIDAKGKVVFKQRLENFDREKLLDFARQHLRPDDCVALEATTNTWAVARLLQPFVAKVVASNPLATKAIAQAKVKTDKIDAEVLAQLLRCDYLPQVWQPDEATSLLRELTSRRTALVGDRTAVRNRIHGLLAVRLLSTPEINALFGPKGRAWLDGLSADQLGSQGRLILDADLRLHDAIEREIKVLEQELAQRGYNDDRVKLLMTLPGVDVTTAEALLAALGDVSRFVDGDHAASYLGLTPSTRQSANHCYHGPITKAGNSHARSMLVQAAHAVARHPGPLGYFFRKLSKRKKYNVAVVATARKLVVIAWHMLTRNEPYRYASPKCTAVKLARLRVSALGKRRPTGSRKGVQNVSRLPGGGRTATIKSLPRIFQEEGLPALQELSPGELRTVEQSGSSEYVTSTRQDRVIPRRKKTTQAVPTSGTPEITS